MGSMLRNLFSKPYRTVSAAQAAALLMAAPSCSTCANRANGRPATRPGPGTSR
jgi:hypothetical protein